MTTRSMPYGWGRVPYDWETRKKWLELPFPEEEYQERITKLRHFMREEDLVCLLVYGNRADTSNIRYLSNFQDFYGGDTLLVLPLEGEVALVTNSIMHGEPMHSGIQSTWIRDVRCTAHPRTVSGVQVATIYDHLSDVLTERRVRDGRLGIVGDFTTELQMFLQHSSPRTPLVDATSLLVKARAVKSAREVEILRKAAHIGDLGLQAILENTLEGISEHELAGLAYEAMFSAGAEDTAFPIALAAGPRAGFKHVPPTTRRLQRGDMVYVDLGIKYQGYTCDASRNRTVGPPTSAQRDFMEANIEITETVLQQVRAGVRICDIAPMGIEIARRRGYEDYLYFRGHGIGVHTHDKPSFSPQSTDILETNMVFVFEPMLVKREFGTACVEDMYRVTPSGYERLSSCPWRWWE